MPEDPLVSIVTPVFNAEPFLRECVESVIAQKYENWEQVIVNNCSTDGSLEIAASYADGDPRIRVHDNERFLSAADNANHALSLISPLSKYTKILHADDWLFPNCVRDMVSVGEACPTVGIVGSYRIRGAQIVPSGVHYPTMLIKGEQAGRMNLMDGPYTFGTPSAHLFRSEVVRGRTPFYDEGHLAHDVDACFDIVKRWDLGFVHQVLVFQRLHESSISAKHAWMRSEYPNALHMLDKHAPSFLSNAERRQAETRLLRAYYRALGDGLLLGRERIEFWKYHSSAIRESGRRPAMGRIAAGAIISGVKRIIGRD